MIGIDTSAIIDLFKEEKSLLNLLKNINDKLASTIINYQEIVFGLNPIDFKHKTEKEHYSNGLLVPKRCRSINDTCLCAAKRRSGIYFRTIFRPNHLCP